MSEFPRDRRIRRWIAVGLALTTLLVFASATRNGFLSLDDDEYVTRNTHVLTGLTLENVVWAFSTWHFTYWHPLTWLSHMLDCELFGLNPAGHHFTNVVLHATSVVLLFHVLRRMTSATWPSAFVAAVFAFHPLHVESVAWVAERKDVLSGLFWNLTLLAYLRWVEAPRPARYAAVVAAYALGLMSKPMVVTLPFVLLLLDVWPLARVRFPLRDRDLAWRLVREKLPLLALAFVVCAVTVLATKAQGATDFGEGRPIGTRIQNALVAFVSYLGKALWPADLSAFYPYPLKPFPAWQVLSAAVVSAGATLLALWQVRARPYLTIGWLWFAGTLIPVIGLLQVGAQHMADRFTYIPLIGLSIAVAWGARDLAARWRSGSAVLAVAFAGSMVVWAALSWSQVRLWKDDSSLFARMLGQMPQHFMSHGLLGEMRLREGRIEEALEELRESVRMNPSYARGLCNLGMALEMSGKGDEAREQYEHALQADPDLAEAHYNLGRLLQIDGRTEDAANHYEHALRAKPGLAEAHNSLALLLIQKGRLAEAIAHLELAVRANPGFLDARRNLEAALAERRRRQPSAQ